MSETPSRRTRRHFTGEFKASVVRLVLDEGKTVGAAARDLATTVTLALSSATLVAQEPRERVVRLGLPFEQVEPTPEERASWEATPEWSGPVSVDRFGFSRLTVNVDRDEDDPYANARARVILGIHQDGRVTYWEPAEAEPAAPIENVDTEWWTVSPRSSIVVSAATPDSTWPVLQIVYGDSFISNGGTRDVRHRLIIDARRSPPVLVADLLDEAFDGRCAAVDRRPKATCAWDAARGDFRCREVVADVQRDVWMRGGEVIPRPGPPDAAVGLGMFIDGLWPELIVGRAIELPEVGAVRVLAEVPSRVRGRRLVILGASPTVGRPLFLAVREQGMTRLVDITVTAIAEPSPPDRAPRAEAVPSGFLPAGSPPRFSTRLVGRPRDGVRLYAVVRDTADGVRRLFHVGVEQRGDTIAVDALDVSQSLVEEALSLAPYAEGVDACDNLSTARAAAVDARGAPLALRYEVEPARDVAYGGRLERLDTVCEVAVAATWAAHRGFRLRSTLAPCPTGRFRAVHVGSDGSVVARTVPEPPR